MTAIRLFLPAPNMQTSQWYLGHIPLSRHMTTDTSNTYLWTQEQENTATSVKHEKRKTRLSKRIPDAASFWDSLGDFQWRLQAKASLFSLWYPKIAAQSAQQIAVWLMALQIDNVIRYWLLKLQSHQCYPRGIRLCLSAVLLWWEHIAPPACWGAALKPRHSLMAVYASSVCQTLSSHARVCMMHVLTRLQPKVVPSLLKASICNLPFSTATSHLLSPKTHVRCNAKCRCKP